VVIASVQVSTKLIQGGKLIIEGGAFQALITEGKIENFIRVNQTLQLYIVSLIGSD